MSSRRRGAIVSFDTSPCLAPAEDRQPNKASNVELRTVGAETHACAVDLPGFRIEYRAPVIVQSGLLHPFNENQAEERLIELVAWTLPAHGIRVVTRFWEEVREAPYKHAAFLRYGNKRPNLSGVVNLAPDACRGRFAASRVNSEERTQGRERQAQGNSTPPFTMTLQHSYSR